ncbi:MAG: Gx transporter family protein, partial [Firmicutes bacterium]|nr:Gx transporter family protein [Bacillota bacterium]
MKPMSSQAKTSRSSDRRTRLLAISAMFAALALIFSYVEVLIPVPVPVPGIKLGLANLVIIIALYRMGFRYAFTINMVRIVAAGLLFSGVFGMIYSFAGGILSIIVMYLLYRTDKFSMVGVSMAG